MFWNACCSVRSNPVRSTSSNLPPRFFLHLCACARVRVEMFMADSVPLAARVSGFNTELVKMVPTLR